jgi:hypothetical protein
LLWPKIGGSIQLLIRPRLSCCHAYASLSWATDWSNAVSTWVYPLLFQEKPRKAWQSNIVDIKCAIFSDRRKIYSPQTLTVPPRGKIQPESTSFETVQFVQTLNINFYWFNWISNVNKYITFYYFLWIPVHSYTADFGVNANDQRF